MHERDLVSNLPEQNRSHPLTDRISVASRAVRVELATGITRGDIDFGKVSGAGDLAAYGSGSSKYLGGLREPETPYV